MMALDKVDDIVLKFVDKLSYLDWRSKDKSYLPDFSASYNSIRREAYETLTTSQYTEAIERINKTLNKFMYRKLRKQYGEEVIKFAYLIDEPLAEIPNKYARYKLFGICYNLVGRELLLKQNNTEVFINTMIVMYRSLLNMLNHKMYVSTEKPVTDRSVAMYTIDWENLRKDEDYDLNKEV